jgi:hypothetical protein
MGFLRFAATEVKHVQNPGIPLAFSLARFKMHLSELSFAGSRRR